MIDKKKKTDNTLLGRELKNKLNRNFVINKSNKV